MNRSFSARMAIGFAILYSAGPGFADDRPLIWKPSRNSDTSYSVKLGMKLPDRLETEAGVSMGIDTTRSGTPINTPIKFWSNFTAEKIQTPAYQAKRGVGVNLDGMNGSAAISMNYYEKEIATPTVDIERRSTYGMRYDGSTGEWCGMDASQSVRLSHTPSGMAVTARASSTNGFKVVGAGVTVEKKLGRHMTVGGAIDQWSDSTDPVTSVNARYSFRW